MTLWLVDGAAGFVVALSIYLALGLREVNRDERGVVWRFGQVLRVVGPGKLLIFPLFERFALIDMRPFTLKIDLQALTTHEGTSHACTLKAECLVLQPERAAEGKPDHVQATRALLEDVVRQAAAEMEAGEWSRECSRLGRGLKKIANEQSLTWGVDVQVVEVAPLETAAGDVQLASERPEAGTYKLVLQEVGPQAINVIKLVREATGLGLAAAKAIVDKAPMTVQQDLAFEQAERLRKALELVGARATVE